MMQIMPLTERGWKGGRQDTSTEKPGENRFIRDVGIKLYKNPLLYPLNEAVKIFFNHIS